MSEDQTPAGVTERARIILVQSDPLVRRSVQLRLQANGHEVRAYASCDALLSDDSALFADCVVIEQDLPQLVGPALVAMLRSRGWQGPAILIAEPAAAEIVLRSGESDFAHVLVRPVAEHRLVSAISSLIASKRHPHPPRALSSNG